MNASRIAFGSVLIAVGFLFIGMGISVPEVVGSTGNDMCCNPARVDQPSSPGGCTPCDDCMRCHVDGCTGTASLVAVDGSCSSSEGSNCSMGTGLRIISTGVWDCDEEAYPDCACTYVSVGQSQQVQVQDCSGDHC